MQQHSSIRDEIHQLKHTVCAPSATQADIDYSVYRLEHIFLTHTFSQSETEEIIRLFGTTLHKYYEHYFFRPTVKLEQQFVTRVLRDKRFDARHMRTRNLLFNGAPTLLRHEIQRAKVQQHDTIAFIGSGPFPLSALIYHRYSNATIHCIDKDKQSCLEAKRLIKALGLDTKLKVIHAHGEELVNQNYTLVAMATQAYPKNAILNNLATILQKDTKVLVREQSGLGSIFVKPEDSLSKKVLNTFTHIDTLYRKDNLMKSLLYTVK